MKQKKIFLRFSLCITFLWMMGITQGWAMTDTYTVTYTGVPTGQTGGYTVTDRNVPGSGLAIFSGYISSNDNATTLVVENTHLAERDLTTSNILSHIRPKSFNGYQFSVTVSSGKVVTIAYRAAEVMSVYYLVNYSPSGIDGGVEVIQNSIDVTYNSNTYPCTVGNPIDYTIDGTKYDAIPVDGVPYKKVSGKNVPYSYHKKNGFFDSSYPVPGPITGDNVNQFLKAKEVEGYTATISNVTTYYNSYSYIYQLTVTYSISHTIYYRVEYNDGAPSGAGFSLRTSSGSNNTTFRRSGTTVTASNSSSYSYAPVRITSGNVDDVISATTVNGYNTKVLVPGRGTGTQSDPYIITVNYYAQNKYKNWVIDGLEYSTYYVKSTGEEYLLPDGEVAVSLYKGNPLSGGIYGSTDLWEIREVTDTVKYASGINKNGTQLTTTTGRTSTVADDDGDTAGTNATYRCLGQLANNISPDGGGNSTINFSSDYYYLRTHQVYVSKVTDAVIPVSVNSVNPQGEFENDEYQVTAIQKFGFTYPVTHQSDLPYCTDGLQYQVPYSNNDHRNDYLQTVKFEQPVQIRSIGDYAFMSCQYLESFTVPYTTEYLGQGTFECCPRLKTVTFQTNPDTSAEDFATTRLRTIENWTFWNCTGLRSVYLADGITRIEGQSSGSSFQYNVQLSYIRLPNTLEYIGPHFLCTASSLQTVTIPASVSYIDGACFHGCESLKNVYLLGHAAYLEAGDGDSNTFDANNTYCGDHVQDCDFWVPEPYIDEYKNNKVWKLVDENHSGDYRNALNAIPIEPRTFQPDVWQTVIFPQRMSSNSQGPGIGVRNYREVFGEGTLVAELTEVHQEAEGSFRYFLTFTEIAGNDIPSGKPLLIKPAQKVEDFVMFDKSDMSDHTFLLDMSDEHKYYAAAPEDGSLVYMKGCYVPQTKLARWDFYMSKKDDKYVFRKVMDFDKNLFSGSTKCWWTFEQNGVPINVESGEAKMPSRSDIPSGINDVQKAKNVEFVIDGVYDLNGRKMSLSDFENRNLKRGIYIVNGKKIVIK